MRTLAIIFLFLTASTQTVKGQSITGMIKGKLQDSTAKQALQLATVTVYRAADTSIVAYRMSDENGEFKVPSLPLDQRLRVLITFSGYRVFRKEFQLDRGLPIEDLGIVTLATNGKLLDEVLIFAERPPVSIRKDTIEFNVAAFKTLPSALVADLLKKLPGVDIDLDGNIVVRGRRVNRILVDGREFFGGDPKIATRNLPANIVDKVEVMDDKEQLERNPDVQPLDLGQVVNLKLKKSIKQGWFGKVYGGAGTNSKHEAGLVANIFRDTTQISILGYSNNVNKPGFGMTDLQKLGGFDRGSTGGQASYGEGGGIQINGVSLGGIGQGDLYSVGGGANFNHQWGKALTLNLQYFYGGVSSDFQSVSNVQRFFGDTIQLLRGSSVDGRNDKNNRLGSAVIWKTDPLTTITFRPEISFGKTVTERYSASLISDNKRGQLNNQETRLDGSTNVSSYNHILLISRNFKKRGRTLTINQELRNNDNTSDDYYTINNEFFLGTPRVISSAQLRKREVADFSNVVSTNFTEPVSKTLSLRLQHSFSWLVNQNNLSPYHRNSSTGKFSDLVDSLNGDIKRTLNRNGVNTGISWKKDKWTITPSLNLQWIDFKNQYLKAGELDQSYFYLFPTLNARWKDFSISYGVTATVPNASIMKPIADNTNPQYIFIGNPNLKPTVQKVASLNYSRFTPAGNSLSFSLVGIRRENTFIREVVIDKFGIQTAHAINGDPLKSTNLSVNYTLQIKSGNGLKASIRPSAFISYTRTPFSFNGIRSYYDAPYYSGRLNTTLNWNDKIEVNGRYYVNLSQAYYPDNTYYKDFQTLAHTGEFEIVIRHFKHLVWESLINYAYNPDAATGIRKSVVQWNTALNYLFLKQDNGQLRLSVFDLLDQNISVSSNIADNTISDLETTTIRRYFMLTFVYNIRALNAKKVGGKDRLFLF